MKIYKAIIEKDENGVYLELPCGEKKYFTDDREFMNAYYAHEVLKQFYEQDHRIAVLERALKLACDWFGRTGFSGDQTEIKYFIKQAEKELKNK